MQDPLGIKTGSLAKTILIIALVLVSSAPSGPITDVRAVSWLSATNIPLPTPTDTKPSVMQDNTSLIWLAYQSSAFGVNPQSYLTTYNFISWTNPVTITSDRNSNIDPSIQNLSNGTIFLAWISNRTGNDDVWLKTNTNGVWSRESQLTNSASSDEAPSVTQDLHGNIWVFWERVVLGNANIFYRKYTPGVGWGSEAQLTTEANPIDTLPASTVTTDGKVWVAWSSHRTGTYQTWIKNYNGTVWSPDTQVTFFSKGDDSGPSLTQTRDGTLWLAWSRDIAINRTYSQGDIFYQNSTDLGKTWGGAVDLTNSTNYEDFGPTTLQASNDRFYIFWSTNMPPTTDFGIWSTSAGPILIHQLTVRSIATSQNQLYPGGFKLVNQSAIVRINASITDSGDFQELAITSFYANSTLITSTTMTLLRTQTEYLTANWNTTGWKPGCYRVKVVLTVTGETLTGSNTLTGGTVRLLPLGDVDQNGAVTFIDASTVALAFQSRPGMPHWNVYADADQDNYVSFLDVSTMAANFGFKCPC